MVAFLAALTYLFSELIRTRGDARWYLLAGLFAGLAGATKYNGAVRRDPAPAGARPLGSMGRVGLAQRPVVPGHRRLWLGFFGGNPFALGNMPDFLNGLATVLHHYGTEQPGFEGRGNWRWYLTVFFTLGRRAVDAGGDARAWPAWSGATGRRGLLLLAFPLLYFVMVSRFVVRFERNMVPLLPFLALGGAWLLDSLATWLARRFRAANSKQQVLLACCLLLAACCLPLAASIAFDVQPQQDRSPRDRRRVGS